MSSPSLFQFFLVNATGQLLSRVCSFLINLYLLRKVDPTLLGLVNVRLTLLYTTLLFLVREPLRKTCLSEQVKSIPQYINHLWLAPVICFCISTLLVPVWYYLASSSVPTEYSDGYLLAVLSFVFASFIECLAEPFAIISQKSGETTHFAFAQSLLILLQRVFLLAILVTNTVSTLAAFCISQVLSATVYLAVHVSHFYKKSSVYYADGPTPLGVVSFRDYFPSVQHGLNDSTLSMIGSFFLHSVFKQILTDGAGFVMTFTNTIELANQAVYGAIEGLGSLVARIVLAPLEESSFWYFSRQFERDVPVRDQSEKAVSDGVQNLKSLLRITTLLSVVVIVFGIAYSGIAVVLYGGDLLVKNQGGPLLSCYLGYLFVMAINGITECFATATMSNSDVFKHMGFLLFAASAHVSLNIAFSFYFAAFGFIAANCVNMILRILYSWKHIRHYLGKWTPSIVSMIPPSSTVLLLVIALLTTNVSNLIFGSTAGLIHNGAHIAVGGVMFLFVTFKIYSSEDSLQRIVNKRLHHQE